MNNLDLIKRSIHDETVARDTVLDNAATQK